MGGYSQDSHSLDEEVDLWRGLAKDPNEERAANDKFMLSRSIVVQGMMGQV